MSIEITLMVLLAAMLNAGWNTLIKVSGDRIAVMAVVTLLGSFVSALALPFIDMPDPASWPLLALAILLHTGYHFVLPVAYNYGDLGQVYPIARGSAPLLVTLGAAFFAGEVLSVIPFFGVAFLAVGVMALAFDQRTGLSQNPRAVLFALGTGASIAAYTLVDGLGARQAGSVMGFAVCLTIGDGLLTFLVASTWKAKAIKQVVRTNLTPAVLAGGMQVGAYWIAIWALAHAPLGMVSALRETSVLFAALISTFILKEGFGVWRFVSAGLIACGIGLTRYKP
ncbi:EamA-like transporter family protein [Modicisalibacter muralis]|uniref:EamA-like transporter family protein n=1 Tax=Modicisalibacter muralis TaxID=119000 RepID=A0A1G9I6X5_9GAMM|nr:EamA family transporter [Halomonas muralis]SDL20573.1 EamA-like transporter family protein [Halomonas muralis]